MSMSRRYAATVAQAVESLESVNAVSRIWARDYTLWADNPTEIEDRLGWLDIATAMRGETDALTRFASEARDEGIRHIVLLGMGGSSLGAETLRQCFGQREGWPELVVLDSTLPVQIKRVTDTIDIARTLFVVSSKSGTTAEPNLLYRYFREQVQEAGNDGGKFVAITDPGAPLESMAKREGFRKAFLNPPDVCGRYSVLSYFGLVPAALAGYDITGILDSADKMRSKCSESVPPEDNPGALIGAAITLLAEAGRDKLTILTSPALDSFGLWAEQLVAESLGKCGRGIVPVTAEPLGEVGLYGDDRQFVHLKLSQEGSEVDALTSELERMGHPVIRYELDDLLELGGEFYRWEFAVATTAALIGVHPFNQPDVERAKHLTRQALESSAPGAGIASPNSENSLAELLSDMKAGDYLTVLAYIPQTPENDAALSRLRFEILDKYGIPTTLGYGPRYLHSTGQLHKGGPNNVTVLMIVSPHGEDIEIPGVDFTFGALADAQATADLQALREAGRRTAYVNLGNQLSKSVDSLTQTL